MGKPGFEFSAAELRDRLINHPVHGIFLLAVTLIAEEFQIPHRVSRHVKMLQLLRKLGEVAKMFDVIVFSLNLFDVECYTVDMYIKIVINPFNYANLSNFKSFTQESQPFLILF